MKRVFLIFLLMIFLSVTFAGYISIFLGVALSGVIFPYIGIRYNANDVELGGSLGFVMGPDEKGSGQWYYMFSPSVEMAYFLTGNFSVRWNARALIVIPYQNEQLYLTGIGGGYSFPILEGNFSIKLNTDFILPISAGKKAWDRGRLAPIPFIEADYEFKIISLDDL